MSISRRFLATVAATILFAFSLACGGGEPERAAPEAAPAAEPTTGKAPDLSQAGAVSGKVSYQGPKPEPARIRMGAEPQCEAKHSGTIYSQELEVNDDGTLRNAFVWVKSGLEQYKFDAPATPAVLNQEGCVYKPHVFGVQTDQEIQILNSDPVTHNIHPVPQSNREWNISQSPNQELARSFARQEVMIPVKCNVHPWMKSYIGVIAHPYFAVTGSDGAFEIGNLPPGDYLIEVWHEKLGTREQQVTLGPKEAKTVDFSFSG